MACSVSYPTGAIVAFQVIEVEHPDEWEGEYEALVNYIVETSTPAFPSMERHDGWRGREDRILARNVYADIGISTYCGVVAIWIAERDDDRYWEADYQCSRTGRAQNWLAQIEPRFLSLFGQYHCIGRFSNGEAIYEKREKAAQAI